MFNSPKIAFFGTSDYSVMVLNALKAAGFTPALVVAQPDKPKGRKLIITPPPTKVWALENNISVLQPDKLKSEDFINAIKNSAFDLFIVVAYGKIIPAEILALAKYGALNVHASLLPKLRGASPIETAILQDEKNTGVTIMVVDAEMDHGPIVAQAQVTPASWPPRAPELGKLTVQTGADLLVTIIPDFIAGKITPIEQDHSQATFTRKITKEDGEIDLNADPYQNFLKIQAYCEWPTAYFFIERGGVKTRVIIKEARYINNSLEILRVVPEGKKETDYKEFLKTLVTKTA